MPQRPIIVFGVNETLLNLDAIRPIFDRIFNDPAAMRLWFANLITSRSVTPTVSSSPTGSAGRPGSSCARQRPLDVGPQPDYIGKDLDAIADQLTGKYAAAAG